MRAISIIFSREMSSYLRSPLGYIVAATLLLVDGILFQSNALGAGERLSAHVLREFFRVTSGVTMIAGIALSIRLIEEERQKGTIILLNTSPVRDIEIVIGKFLSAWLFLAGMLMLSLYMPLLILVNGKITISQLVVGYVGLLMLGGCSLAIGMFASAVANHVLVAIAVGGAINVIMVVLYPLAKKLDAPLKDIFQKLDLWHIHFQQGFMKGIFNLKDFVFYAAVIYFFLLLAVKTMEAKRWR